MQSPTRNVYLCPQPRHQAARRKIARSKSEGCFTKTLTPYTHGIVRSYETTPLPYLTNHSGSPNGNVEPLTKFHPKRGQIMVPTPEEAQDLAERMSRLRRQGNKTVERRKEHNQRLARNRLAKYEPTKKGGVTYNEEEMRVMREQLYGTQGEKEEMRRRAAVHEAKKMQLRQLPLDKIWNYNALRSRKAAERSQVELEEMKAEMPAPAPKKSTFVGDEPAIPKMGFGKKGVLEGRATLMLRCNNLPQPEVPGLQRVNIVGHEDECEGQGWRCFGETNRTDEVIHPVFYTRFAFPFVHPTETLLKLRVLRKAEGGKSVFLGGCEVNLHDIIQTFYTSHDASECNFVEHIHNALHKHEHAKLEAIVQTVEGNHLANDPKHHETHAYRHTWFSDEGMAMIHVPMTALDSESEELQAQLDALRSELVFVVQIEPTKVRPPALRPFGNKSKDKKFSTKTGPLKN